MGVENQVVAIPVAGMTCNHCVNAVRKALQAVPGVAEAAVDLEEGLEKAQKSCPKRLLSSVKCFR